MDLARNEDVRVYPLEPQDQIEQWPDRQVGQMVEAKLKELLGPRTLVASKVNGERALWVSFDIEGDQYWLIAIPSGSSATWAETGSKSPPPLSRLR